MNEEPFPTTSLLRVQDMGTFVPGGVILAIKLLVSAMTSDWLLFMKSAKVTDLFLMDPILLRLPVNRQVLGLDVVMR